MKKWLETFFSLLEGFFYVIFPLIVFGGCSPKYQVEVIPQEQETRREILKTPTNFLLPPNQDQEAWGRARYFVTTFTKGKPTILSNRIASDRSTKADFLYEIARKVQKGEVQYEVKCLAGPNLSSDAANLNAKNLARFLQNGQLEVSMLRR